MKYITTQRMRRLDQIAIERYGIPSLILMENAGRGIADLAECVIPAPAKIRRGPTGRANLCGGKAGIHKYGSPIKVRHKTGGIRQDESRHAFWRTFGDDRTRKGNILVICGKGNNGGDGFVTARHLANRGYNVQVIALAEASALKNDPKLNYEILKKMRVPMKHITSENKMLQFEAFVRKSDLIIDGIFGIGLERSVGGLFYDMISVLNASKKRILAIDVPSGLNSDSGEELGIAIQAKATGTLVAAKRGLFVKDGPKCSGKITVIDISIPKKLLS